MSKPLRVAVVTPPPDASGGIGRQVEYERALWRDDPGVQVELVDSKGKSSAAVSLLVALIAAARVTALFAAGRIDGVHVNQSARGSVIRKSVVMSVLRMFRVPYVVHIHGSGFDEDIARMPSRRRRRFSANLKAARTVIVLGEFWKSVFHDALGLPMERLTVVKNGTPGPSDVFPLQRDNDAPLRILFAGHVGERKGAELLFDMARRLAEDSRPYRLTVAGDGEHTQFLQRCRDAGFGEYVDVLGWVSSAEIQKQLSRSHLLVLPSYAENQPMSLIEAASYGVPAVSTRVGAIADVIRDGSSGWLVDPGDADGFLLAVSEAYDEHDRRQRAARAREIWLEDLSIDTHWSRLRAVWQSAFWKGDGRG